jgi:hypothetical protein
MIFSPGHYHKKPQFANINASHVYGKIEYPLPVAGNLSFPLVEIDPIASPDDHEKAPAHRPGHDPFTAVNPG